MTVIDWLNPRPKVVIPNIDTFNPSINPKLVTHLSKIESITYT